MIEKIWIKIAWILPRELVKWCAVRLMSSATIGQYENTNPSELTAMEALQRWNG